MKKCVFILLTCLLIFLLPGYPQLRLHLTGKAKNTIAPDHSPDRIPAGAGIMISCIGCGKTRNSLSLAHEGKEYQVSFTGAADLFSPVIENRDQFWEYQAFRLGSYDHYVKKGLLEALRDDIDQDTKEYLGSLERDGLLYHDPALEKYIAGIAAGIISERLSDGRPGRIRIYLVENSLPRAYMCQNGMLFINTGLLAQLGRDDELTAYLAGEIAHFALDHMLINITAAEMRQDRAAFWATFASLLGTAADIYLSSKNDYHIPGLLSRTSTVLSFVIADEVARRLGLNFSRAQIFEADRVARDFLLFAGKDTNALASAFSRLAAFHELIGDKEGLKGEEEGYPSLQERLARTGRKVLPSDEGYTNRMASLISRTASQEYGMNHYAAALELLDRNQAAGNACGDDYLLLAMISLELHDDSASDKRSLEYIYKAIERFEVQPLNVYKQESIALMRLGRNDEAAAILRAYISRLDHDAKDLESQNNSAEKTEHLNHIQAEKYWASDILKNLYK